MARAIRITLKRAEEGYDVAASKLFGAPLVPLDWEDKFAEDILFFGQIRLSDIAALDTENKLPHTGYLYLFLDTEMYPYMAWAEYYDGEPNLVIDDFNEAEPQFSHLNQAFLMSFSTEEGDCDGTKLFGKPSFGEHEGELLLQFDPLDNDTGFLNEVDGYAYFFFGKGRKRIDGIEFFIDHT